MSSRLDKTILNAKVTFFYNLVSFALAFFSRRIFLERLGTEFLGLNSTLQNLLGFLALAELGVGSAIAYVLYKPLAENDQQSINEIISILGYYYRRIGIVIAGSGVLLSCFLPLIYAKSSFSLPVVYFGFYTFLISTLIGYFINYRMTLLSADQKNYVVTQYYKTGNIIQILLQMMFAYYIASPYIFFTVLLLTNIFYSIILNWKINITYPNLKTDLSKGKKYLERHNQILILTKQIFIQKITGFASGQLTPILLYAFVSLESVTLFANYESVISKFSLVTYALFGSVFASVGNLIASSTKEKSFAVMKELFALSFFLTGLCLFGIFLLMDDFVILWIGKQYVLSKTLLWLFMFHFFLGQQAGIVEMFVNGFGLFSDVFAPACLSAIYLLVAIPCGYFWGQAGVFSGTIVSQCVIWQFWKTYYVFSRGFHMSVSRYWLFWGRHILAQVVGWIICYHVMKICLPETIDSWFVFAWVLCVATLLYVLVVTPIMYFTTEGTKEVFWRLWKRFLRDKKFI